MTIKECIDIVDDLKPNQYSTKIKVMWLSFVDETIINDVLKTHQGYDGRYDDFTGYTEDKLSIPLIVSSPYDRLYTAYLKMKIDAENGETARYNNSAALFNSYMMEYRKFYNKTHMPLSESGKQNIKPINRNTYGISKAELENLKRELYAKLTEEFLGMVSNDKVYDIVTNYVYNNLEMIKANDGDDGLTPFINENGNWQIGGNDTGIKAQGEQGKDAVTDQAYNSLSPNAQSGVAVAQAVSGQEKTFNKVSVIEKEYIDNNTYPSTEAVYNFVGATVKTGTDVEPVPLYSLATGIYIINGPYQLKMGMSGYREGYGSLVYVYEYATEIDGVSYTQLVIIDRERITRYYVNTHDFIWIDTVSIEELCDAQVLSNKTTVINSDSTDTEYPSAKAVYEFFANNKEVINLTGTSDNPIVFRNLESGIYNLDGIMSVGGVQNLYEQSPLIVYRNEAYSTGILLAMPDITLISISESDIGYNKKILAIERTESKDNKVDVLQEAMSNEAYPTANAVYNAINNIETGIIPSINISWSENIAIPVNIEIKPIVLEGDTTFELEAGSPERANIWAFAITQGETVYNVVLPEIDWQLGIAPTFAANTTTEVRLYYIGDTLKGVWNT